MFRPSILLSMLFAIFAEVSSAKAAPPNMVFIMADDLGWADVGFHGGTAPTPNLDRLAREGLELTRHYVAPVCSPTRAGLLTGRFWSRFGVTTPQSERALPWPTVTLPRALKSAGYETALCGKWHLGSKPEWGPNHFGFDHTYGSLGGGVGPWDHAYKKGPFSATWHRDETLISEEGHVTDLITQDAVKWLDQRPAGKPFFLYLPYTAVHLPVKEPDEWVARVPASISGEVARHYAACIMHLDDAVGRILATLEKTGRRSETLVVFTSDNGGSTAENNGQSYPPDDYPSGPLPGNNKPMRGEKGQLYEGGIRVPCVLSWPGVVKPGKYNHPVHICDWMPTLCGLAGWKAETNLKWDGADVWPALMGQSEPPARLLYWTAPGFRARAVLEGDWKLIVSQGKGKEATKTELFDLAKDPQETRDLAAAQPEKTATLQTRLQEAAARDKDAVAED